MGLFDVFKRRAGSGEPDPRMAGLLEQLTDKDPARRAEACEELGSLGAPALVAIEALEEAMTDEDDAVCTAAAGALNALRSAS